MDINIIKNYRKTILQYDKVTSQLDENELIGYDPSESWNELENYVEKSLNQKIDEIQKLMNEYWYVTDVDSYFKMKNKLENLIRSNFK